MFLESPYITGMDMGSCQLVAGCRLCYGLATGKLV